MPRRKAPAKLAADDLVLPAATLGTPRFDTAALQVRLRRHLKGDLDRAAVANNRSLNGEIQARLEASFATDDALGGPRLRLLTLLWNAAFQHGGHLGARAAGHPEWTPDQWLDDPVAYRTALVAGDDALRERTPRLADEAAAASTAFEELAHRLARGESLPAIVAALTAGRRRAR